jgi:hypothetical protein
MIRPIFAGTKTGWFLFFSSKRQKRANELNVQQGRDVIFAV